MSKVKPINISEESGQNELDVCKKLKSETVINYGNKKIQISPDKLEKDCELGRGRYGKVLKYTHKTDGISLAIKQIAIGTETGDTNMIKEITMSLNPPVCCYLLKSYGSIMFEGEIWVLLPLMDMSLDKLLEKVIEKKAKFPTEVLSFISYGTIQGLEALHKVKIIHRDVKPSNLLVNRNGDLKICDFGISGILINSIANTNVGSELYLAPERIESEQASGYGIKSDVWSLGLSILELANLEYPFPGGSDVFDRLEKVVYGPSPTVKKDRGYPKYLEEFIDYCLVKDITKRPTYVQLLTEVEWLSKYNPEVGSKALAEFLNKIQ